MESIYSSAYVLDIPEEIVTVNFFFFSDDKIEIDRG